MANILVKALTEVVNFNWFREREEPTVTVLKRVCLKYRDSTHHIYLILSLSKYAFQMQKKETLWQRMIIFKKRVF